MLDIRVDPLYIKEIRRVVVSHLTKRHIPMGNPRVDDAFIYTIAGSCRFELADGTEHITQSGDVMYLARGEDYGMEILSEEYEYIPCVFSFDTDELCQSVFIRPQNPTLFGNLFQKLAKKQNVTEPGQKQTCMALLYQICAAIAQNDWKDYVPGSTRLRIENSRAYIQEHITQSNLRVADLAEKAEMSEVHFRKLFASIYRVSPSAYILHERVNYAKELMNLKELRLEEVAVQSGFSSLAHMCKVFKSQAGISPGTYRANHVK